jgi:hypothetical protein
MQRVRRSTAVAVQPAPPIGVAPGFFSGGNPGGGIPATVPGFEWYNDMQEEVVAPIQRAGLTLDPADQAQLRKALDRLYGGGLRSVSANATLTADDAGLVLIDASGGNRTITLPAANAANGRPLRFELVRTDSSANAVTVQRAGSDTIEGASSVTLPVGGRVALRGDGGGGWWVLDEGARGQSYGASGWQRFPGGLIIQWGIISATTGALMGGISEASFSVTFPLTFPTACRAVATSVADVSGFGAQEAVGVSVRTVSGFSALFSCRQPNEPMSATYIALGH